MLVGRADASKEKQCSFSSWSSKESWRVTEACWGNAAEKEALWPQLWGRVIPSEGLDHLTVDHLTSSESILTTKDPEGHSCLCVHLPTGRDDAA